jgi:pimeloyl-ACP methyl ester carboxylesterase
MTNERDARVGVWPGWPNRAGGPEVRRPSRRRRPRALARVAVAVAALMAAGCGTTSRDATLPSRLLSVADLPAGWSAPPAATKSAQATTSPCGAILLAVVSPQSRPKSPLGPNDDSASFAEGAGIPGLHEVLASGRRAQEAWERSRTALAGCRTATFVDGATTVAATVKPLALAQLGASTLAYSWTLGAASGGVGVDLVLFHAASYYGYLAYIGLGSSQVSTVTAFARAAMTKAANGSTARVPGTGSIASAPVQTVHTALGTVAYRAIGNGSALVMINGYSARMEDWDPLLVDALAEHHRVVVFDNAGVGRTQSLPTPLTIDAMANQTAAFIDALHLGRPAVLGWSMGTAVAQALAVLHPRDVARLVLCAPYPGTGAVVLPPRKVMNSTNDPTALFPADQTAAEGTYDTAILSYPKAPPAPRATDTAQLHALDRWWAGGDQEGHLVAKITVPTLLADGTADRLDPVANAHLLAQLIPRATLKLYSDAGHAFLFQDYAAFAARVDSFLSQTGSQE